LFLILDEYGKSAVEMSEMSNKQDEEIIIDDVSEI
jgi:hypothetical protein